MTNALRFICMGLLFTALSAPVQALEGAGMLGVKERLKIKSCGKETVETVLVFTLTSADAESGRWEAMSVFDDPIYKGTWRACCVRRAREKGRIELKFDTASLDDLMDDLEERMEAGCGGHVEVENAIRKKFKGKVKNGEAKIKIKFDLTSTGSSAGGVWKVKAIGPFTDRDP